jgi:hypothetical protein
MFPSSRIHAFYGPYGAGKSFAISYLANPKTRNILLKHIASAGKTEDFLAISVAASLPLKAGLFVQAIYLGIFTKLFTEVFSDRDAVRDFRTDASRIDGIVGRATRNIAENMKIGLDGRISQHELDKNPGHKLLNLERSTLGSMKTQADYVAAIKAVTEPLLGKYRRIIIAIDELENLRQVSMAERLFLNDFIRKLHAEIETGLTLILVFSLNTFEEVGAILQPAVVSRISETISFDYVRGKEDIIEYIQECFEKGAGIQSSDLIEPEALNLIADDLLKFRKEVTFRDVNKQLHRIFGSLLYLKQKERPIKITKVAYEGFRKKLPVDDILRELGSAS